MTSVKGIFENGQVKLLEQVKGKTGQRLIIIFLEEEGQWEEADVRNLSLSQPNHFLQEYLADEREDLYRDYAKKSSE